MLIRNYHKNCPFLVLRAGLMQNRIKKGTVNRTELQNTNFSLKIQPGSHLKPLEY